MTFNPSTDANILLSKKHREMLKAIAKEQRRSMRGALELMIEHWSDFGTLEQYGKPGMFTIIETKTPPNEVTPLEGFYSGEPIHKIVRPE